MGLTVFLHKKLTLHFGGSNVLAPLESGIQSWFIMTENYGLGIQNKWKVRAK